MNLLKFWKSKSGKLTLGVPQLVTLAGVGLFAANAVYHMATPKEVKRQHARSFLSLLGSPADYEQRNSRGQLSSVNVGDRLNQIATQADLERMSGSSQNDFGLSAADNIDGAVWAANDGADVGRSAELGVTEGLGMGANKVYISNPYGSSSDTGASVSAQAAAQKAALARTAVNQLNASSVTRASGRGVGSSYGGSNSGRGGSVGSPFSGRSGGRADGLSLSGGSSGGKYKMSDQMDAGSVGLIASAKQGRSSFGGSQNKGGFGQGKNVGRGNELRDMAKHSAAIASGPRASNEGSDVFLAGGKTSGGMLMQSSGPDSTAPTAKWEKENTRALERINETADTVTNDANDIFDDTAKLIALLTALGSLAIPMLRMIRNLKKMGKVAWAWVLAGTMIAAGGVLIWRALDFLHKYNNSPYMSTGLRVVGWVVGGVGLATIVAAIVAACAKPAKKPTKAEFTDVEFPEEGADVIQQDPKITFDEAGFNDAAQKYVKNMGDYQTNLNSAAASLGKQTFKSISQAAKNIDTSSLTGTKNTSGSGSGTNGGKKS